MTRFDVYFNGVKSGVLEQVEISKFAFTYSKGVKQPISLTMPVRDEPYFAPFLHPVFQVSLPQGRLRALIEADIAKRMASAGDIQVLSVVGSHLVGAIQVVPEGAFLIRNPSPASAENIGEMLSYIAGDGFIARFIEKHANHSGVSGGYDKALMTAAQEGERVTFASEQCIVKFDDSDHPALSLNERYSTLAAERAGLDVPIMRLGQDKSMLIIDRFDTHPTGRYAFEDMCSLLGMSSDHKFMGSVEKVVAAIKSYCSTGKVGDSLRAFFTQYLMCSLMRNGDAHLKNFGLLTKNGETSLSPAFDMVTMSAYAPVVNGRVDDHMALAFNGSKRWLTQKDAYALGARCGLSKGEVDACADRIATAMEHTARSIKMSGSSGKAINSMLNCWQEGLSSFSPETRRDIVLNDPEVFGQQPKS